VGTSSLKEAFEYRQICQSLDTNTDVFYASPEFKAKASQHAGFFNAIKPFLDQRPDNLENMVSVSMDLNL